LTGQDLGQAARQAGGVPEEGRRLRVLLSGGGTAGHVAPALAVASELAALRPGAELLYLGTADGIEADLVRRAGIPFAEVKVTALAGRRAIAAARSLWRAGQAILQSRRLVRGFRPDVVLGTGGYVAGPVLAAAWSLGVATAIHEQNLRPGITNRLLSRIVRRVLVSFEESRACFPAPEKVVHTGYPVRPEIVAATRPEGQRALGIQAGRPTLLVVGGSRGARSLNEAVKAGFPLLFERLPHLQALVSTGSAYYEDVVASLEETGLLPSPGRRLQVFPYIHEMRLAYAAADLVLCRAGGSVHELTARGLPAILVPSPNVAYDQQMDNAMVMVRGGAARLLRDDELTGESLASVVTELLTTPGLLRKMASAASALARPEAGRRIAGLLLELAGAGRDKQR